MILPFSTKIDGKPTYFAEKILIGLLVKKLVPENDFNSLCPRFVVIPTADKIIHRVSFDYTIDHKPKLHTIREDKNDRWRVGTKINFYINARQKNMYRFAPVLPVVSTQKIEFIWKDNTENLTCLGMSYDKTCTIIIDNRFFGDVLLLKGTVVSGSDNLPRFAQNDGFDTLQDLLDYFNTDFTGKIIHWTNLKY